MRSNANVLVRRAVAFCLAVWLICLPLAGCSKSDPQSVLYRRGMSVIRTMCDAVASEDYRKLVLTGMIGDSLEQQRADGSTLSERLNENHYKTAEAVFMIGASAQQDIAAENLPESLRMAYDVQADMSLSTRMILGKGDSNDLVLAMALTATELFTCEGILENAVIHYLYVFSEGLPVMVTFRAGADGAVQAVGYFLFDTGLNLTSVDALKAYMEENYKFLQDVTVEKVH